MSARQLSSRSVTEVTALLVWCLWVSSSAAGAASRTGVALDQTLNEVVHPFLQTYCVSCHGADKQKGKLDLRPYTTRETVVRDYRRWELVRERLKNHEMPPEEAKSQPPDELRQRVIQWIQAARQDEARRLAGDPGPVPTRRLSNAEYDYTIRDLTGVDIRPAKEFPVDPANEAGFDNSAESLAMSPALLKKYLEAARQVAEHLVFKPDGFVFAPHPVVTETDRDKYCVKRIIDFYQRQRTDYVEYLMAAWRFRHRAALGKSRTSLSQIALSEQLSPKYLTTLWDALTAPGATFGPLETLRKMWGELPPPRADQPDDARRAEPAELRQGCERMRDFIVVVRQSLKPKVNNLAIDGIAPGSQPFVLWKDRQLAANHQRYDSNALRTASSPPAGATTEPKVLTWPAEPAMRARYETDLARFCRIFPDAFYVSERVLIFLKEDKDSRGRLLSAGFHLMTGYFRDDAPLAELLLDEQEQRELNRFWDEFHFVTLDVIRQYKDFVFFERAEPPRFMQGAEFDFARSEDKDVTSENKIRRLAEPYVAKAQRKGGQGESIEAIRHFFKSISAEIRWVEQAKLAAEPHHLIALQHFAERAYRRPLSSTERAELTAFYRRLRDQDELDHEDALRDAVISVLMSPAFCYRTELGALGQSRAKGPAPWKAQPLSDHALASRLSYFLWSSMPDAELLARAKAGDLHRPKVLRAQTHRMLQDKRVRGLATEFGANWLDFRRFEEHNSVDRTRFPAFDNTLRAAMFEEPIQFFTDIIRRDGSLLEFLEADYTWVNPVLARHYGMADVTFQAEEWQRVEQANRYGRGGVLPMAVFLTKNAPGLRTSPVKRGYWVVRRLLGEQIPPPPPTVPELPNDETKLGDLTLREALAKHREDKSCAGCHARFDGVGLVFEGYGPIGERRSNDLAGRPVDTRALFPGGSEGDGVAGLRRYLRQHRQQEFLDNFCRKLLAYGLGRTLLLSDDPLIDDMNAQLAANGYRFNQLVETIVTSPQFQTQRVDRHERAQR